MTEELFPTDDLQTESLAKLASTASTKQDAQEFVDQVMYWLTAPYITWPGYEDIYKARDNKTMALVRRLAHHEEIHREKACTEFEAMLYISTATLEAPTTHSWYRIYMYLFQKEMPEQTEAIKGLSEVKELHGSELEDLIRLRRWIYKTQVLHLKQKDKPEAKETKQLAREVRIERPRLFE